MNKPLLDEALVRTHPVIFSSKEPSPGLERRFSEYMYDFEKKLGKASDTLFLNLKEKEGDPMLIFLIKRLIEKYELSDKQVSKIIYLQHSSIDNLTDRESYYQEISEK